MVWLRPIGGSPTPTGTGTGPVLDDDSAQQPGEDPKLTSLLAEKQAAREAEHAAALAAVSGSQQFLPAASQLTRKQLAALKPQPSAYDAGYVGAVASKPPATKLAREARSRRGEQQEWRVTAPLRVKTPQPQLSFSMPALREPEPLIPSSPSVREAGGSGRSRANEVRDSSGPPGTSPRSRSLVHLETLPPKLEPQLRPVSALGAECGPAGLGPRGDAELASTDLEEQLMQERREEARRVVAPQGSPLRSTSSSPALQLGTAHHQRGAAGMGWGAEDGGKTRTLLESVSSQMLHLPTPLDLRKSASLSGLVPPEPTEHLLRAQAADLRHRRRVDATAAAGIKISPPPVRFSSVASIRAAPLEFLATVTDWGSSNASHAPNMPSLGRRAIGTSGSLGSGLGAGIGAGAGMGGGGGTGSRKGSRSGFSLTGGSQTDLATVGQHPQLPGRPTRSDRGSAVSLGMSLGTPAAATHASSAAQIAQAVLSSSAATLPPSGYTQPAAAAYGQQHSRRLFPKTPPRETRDWVQLQASLGAEFAMSASRTRAMGTGPPVPYREVATAVGNFVTGKPTPAAPKHSFDDTHGVPWLMASERYR